MNLKVDVSVSPVLFGEEDSGLVELAIAPEDEDKYSFVRPSNAPADLMDRPEIIIGEWENMDFDERIQAEPTYIPHFALQNVICNYYIYLVVWQTPKQKKLSICTQTKRQIIQNLRITWYTTN